MKNNALSSMVCPVARSLGRIGDGWSIMIMRDALAGLTRFDEFQKSINIAPNILTSRLNALTEDGLLERIQYSAKPLRYEYILTELGLDFRPVLLALSEWGTRNFAPEGRAIEVVERETGRPVRVGMVDLDTGKPISLEEYALVPGPAASPGMRYRYDYIKQKQAGLATAKYDPLSVSQEK